MSTMDDKRLRTLLGELADEVPTHRSVPPALEARFRRRVAMNSVVIGTMIVALGVGAFATVRALGPNKASIAPLTSSSAATTTPACTAGQLRAIGSMTGAAGSREGYIELRNYSAKTCTLRGTPIIALYDVSTRISTSLIFDRTIAQWQADAAARPAGWPVVPLGALGSGARLRCGGSRSPEAEWSTLSTAWTRPVHHRATGLVCPRTSRSVRSNPAQRRKPARFDFAPHRIKGSDGPGQ